MIQWHCKSGSYLAKFIPSCKQYWRNIGAILGILAKIGQDIQYCANIGKQYCANVGISILANISIPILRQYCFTNIGMPILAQYWHANIGQYCYANIGAILFANIGPILFRYYYSNIGQYCQFTYWYACVTSDVLWFCALMSTVLLIKHLQIESREEVVVTYFETDCITRRSVDLG